MSNDPWHICRDGLTPIAVAVSKVAEPDVAELVEWFRSGAGMFFGLSADLTRVTTKSWVHLGTRKRTSTRREMVRRWLQSNRHDTDAREFDSRLTKLIDHLQEWERAAEELAKLRERTWKAKDEAGEFLELSFIIGQTGCDALNYFIDDASDTWNYLKQLDTTIRAELANPLDLTKYQTQLDAIGQTLGELHSRVNALDEVPGIAMVGKSAPAPANGPDSPTGFLGGAALADALGIHATRRDAFFQRLMRQRMSLGDDCWHEVRDPRPNSPRFLYRVDSPKLRDLAAGYKTPKPA